MMKTLRLCLFVSLFSCLPGVAFAGSIITAQPQSASINLGAFASLTVTATGPGAITYQWELDGNAIPGANASSLTISNAQPNEGGNYDVIVTTGGVSEKSTQATITIVIPPSFQSPPTTAVTAINGQSFTIADFLNGGTNPVSYVWTKDGVVVPSQTDSAFVGTATASSAGTYVVTAANSAGTATSLPFVVTVVDSLTITLPNTVTANNGESVTFSPALTGSGPITYSWGGPGGISATTANLTLTNVNASSAGLYVLTVSNQYQSNIQAFVTLIVAVPPAIITQPTDLTLTAGNNFNYFASASGSGTLVFSWTKDGQPITSTTGGNVIGQNGALLFLPVYSADAGTYRFAVSNLYGTTLGDAFKITVQPNPNAPTVTTQPASLTVSAGSTASFSVVASTASGSLTYQWYGNGFAIPFGTSATLKLSNVVGADAGTYTVVVNNGIASTTSIPAILTVGSSGVAPLITQQPNGQTVAPGGSVTFSAVASGTPAPTFQWQKDGLNIAGANGSSLVIAGAQLSDAGNYTVIASNPAGSAPSSIATLTVNNQPQTRVINLSTRAQVGTGANILIAGFIINGGNPKKMLIRALGPTLSNYSVQNPLADPTLTIVDSSGNTVATNDDWQVTADLNDFNTVSLKVGAVPLPPGSKDAAIVTTLTPGGYTALVSGKSNTTGVALVELYEVDTTTANQLINISSRTDVGVGDSVTIAGIIVSGNAPKKFLVRAIGPGLISRGVSGVLADPQFQIIDASNNVVTQNDNWETSDTVTDVKAISASMGVVPLDAGSKDAALTISLAPGGYTVIVRGTNNTSGVALIELYQTP